MKLLRKTSILCHCKHPKILHLKVSDKLAYVNSADSDETALVGLQV